MDDVRPPVPPAHAPARYQHGREVEFTTIADWTTVARTMAPLFARAAELPPRSPVAAQAAAIASATTDPKARAGAALRLVQAQVRYLAQMEAAGGYTPQNADDTWRLRYGDCKAKTALLLALLRELGVPAAPVLASTTGGDGLDAHLPSLGRFNHALVRVNLGGNAYWLDGTRQGDRGLDDLATPALGWVLPLDTADGKLVRLVPEPAAQPQVLQVIRYDASAGPAAPFPTQLKTTFRGDGAVVLQAQLAAVPPEQLDAALKAYWAGVHTAFTAAHVTAAWDPATGEETLAADGTSKLDTSDTGLELQHVELGGAPDIKRDPAANDPEAPYVVDFPSYVETDESVVLPASDTPLTDSLKQADLDEVIAGVAYHRSGSLTGHVYTVVASQRALQPEITALQARASVDPLTALGAQGVYVAIDRKAPEMNAAAVIDSHPTTVDGHLARAYALTEAKRFKEAVGEADAAIAMDPKSQAAWAARALAHAWLADPAATTDADRADALGTPEIVAARARAILAAATGDKAAARAAYRRALRLAPGDGFSLWRLISLELGSGDIETARADVDELLKAHPEQAAKAHLIYGYVEVAAHHQEAAKRELGQASVATPEEALDRARAYLKIGENALARADLDTSIRLKPSVAALSMRAALEKGPDSAAARSDLEAAAGLAPDDVDIQIALINLDTGRQDYAGALAGLNRLLSGPPSDVTGNLLVGRAQVESHLGRRTEMEADFARAQAMSGDNAPTPSVLCEGETKERWRPEQAFETCDKALQADQTSRSLKLDKAILLHRLGREAEALAVLGGVETAGADADTLNGDCYSLASEGMALDRALAECDASLKLRPGDANILDSRGFVLMRLGRDAEALAVYDAALAVNGKLHDSLYGRGLVEARLGRRDDSARDIAAALAGDPQIREKFAAFGLR